MSVVKVMSSSFNYQKDVYQLIRYIFNGDETEVYDLNSNLRFYVGLSPDLVNVQDVGRSERTAQLFEQNHSLWGRTSGHLVHHLVVSFTSEEMKSPTPVWVTGYRISQFYFSQGFINCFGVHTSTDNLHLHFAIDNVSYMTGNDFFIPGEAVNLKARVDRWIAELSKK